jgi:hypothetical protein
VDREVYLSAQNGLVELAGEDVAPVYDGEGGLGVVVARGLYDADLDPKAGLAQPPGARFGLREG